MHEELMPEELRPLGSFTYQVLTEPHSITALLRAELHAEWLQDLAEHPDQPWTRRWLGVLASSTFALREVRLADVRPLPELLGWKTEDFEFRVELESRVAEARATLTASRLLTPIVLIGTSLELMDGHMRFAFLKETGETHAYAYVSG
jgi:hypothetical protein